MESSAWPEIVKIMDTMIAKVEERCRIESPYLFLTGLAYLATGRNNEATYLFYCPQGKAGTGNFVEWERWTDRYAEINPASPMARFLQSDARSRNGRFEEAKEILEGLTTEQGIPDSVRYMAQNSLGVVLWIMEDEDGALVNFLGAAGNLHGFADPWANLGVLDLNENHSSESANGKFDRALEIDENHGMAINGRACAAASTGASAEEILEILETAESNLPFVTLNQAMLTDADEISVAGLRGQWSMKSFNLQTEIGIGIWSIGVGADFGYENGGVYTTLAEGENLLIEAEGKGKRQVGTWFVLNYPLSDPLSDIDR